MSIKQEWQYTVGAIIALSRAEDELDREARQEWFGEVWHVVRYWKAKAKIRGAREHLRSLLLVEAQA